MSTPEQIQTISDENKQQLIKAVNTLNWIIDKARTIKGAKKRAKKVVKELGYL